LGIDNETPGEIEADNKESFNNYKMSQSKSIRPGEVTQIPKTLKE
jgi:hypothetical protein